MFVIVRHGNTFESGEAPRRIGARTDLPLTVAGLTQAEALGAWLATQGIVFTKVLASPLLRTWQTAEAILRHLPASPGAEPCEWLREIDHGPDENRTEEAVLARIGAEALAAWDRDGVPPPDWQVDEDERLAGWRDLFAREQGPVLLVTSNGAARFALLAAGLNSKAGLKLPTGGYGVIRRDERGGLALAEWGRRP